MKNILIFILLAALTSIKAQVIIGDAVGTATTKTSVLLEFAKNQNKGIIVPYVRTLPTASALVGGSIILDATTALTARMRYYNAKISTWVDLSGQDANLSTPVDFLTSQPTMTAPTTAHVIIGDATSTADGVLVLESISKAMVLPTVTDVQNIPSPSPGMMVYVSGVSPSFNKRMAVFNGTKWSFWQTDVPTVKSLTNRIWMDRNLGALQVATSSTDAASYGYLYQWGRFTDGHQDKTSPTTATLSTTDVPGNGNYITPNSTPFDWRSQTNDDLWQRVNGINNPCPTGFRLPTQAEWTTELATWSSQNATGAFNSFLKLPVPQYRSFDGSIVPATGVYWSSTVNGTSVRYMLIDSTHDDLNSSGVRALGSSVRCIKD